MVCSKVFIFTVFAMSLQLAIKNVVEDFEVAANNRRKRQKRVWKNTSHVEIIVQISVAKLSLSSWVEMKTACIDKDTDRILYVHNAHLFVQTSESDLFKQTN